MWDSLTVNGYSFDSATEYNEAKKESEAIDYIKAKMDLADSKTALKIYYKLLEKQNLHTIVGYTFLKELRDSIIASGIIDAENLKPIPTAIAFTRSKKSINEFGDEKSLENDSALSSGATPSQTDFAGGENTAPTSEEIEKKREENYYSTREKKLKNTIEGYKILTKKCYIVIAALIIIIAALFAVTIYRGSLDLSDKEAMVQDKYAAWAEELDAREAAIKEKEKQLNISNTQ